jgi:hypothetical protein
MWQASHALGCKQCYLGVQDAARKVDHCSQQPQSVAGMVVHVVTDFDQLPELFK